MTGWRLGFAALLCFGAAFAHPMYYNEGSSFAAPYLLPATFEARYVVGELTAGELHVFRLGDGSLQPILALLLAPLACGTFQPELWLVGESLGEGAAAPPFEVPGALEGVSLRGTWAPISDIMLQARRGPGLRASFPDDQHYLVVRAPAPGSYVLFTFGQDRIGGTEAGWDALARFNRCEQLGDER